MPLADRTESQNTEGQNSIPYDYNSLFAMYNTPQNDDSNANVDDDLLFV